ncbi:MAG: hypothetical protein ACOYK9_00690 [Chlamydiia bacterium]
MLFFLLCCLGCSSHPNSLVQEQLEALIKDFNKEIFERYSIESVSFGGEYESVVKKITLSYSSIYSLDRSKAVFLVQRIADDFLFYLNRNQGLVCYIKPKPFTRDRLDISIDFFDPKTHQKMGQPFVASVQIKEGRMALFSYDQTLDKLVPG